MRAASLADSCGAAASPRSPSTAATPPISSASAIGRCAIFRSPAQPALLPSTITSLQATSTPDEMLARSRSEEHTSELQSLMRISYAVFCLKKKKHEATMRDTDKAREGTPTEPNITINN